MQATSPGDGGLQASFAWMAAGIYRRQGHHITMHWSREARGRPPFGCQRTLVGAGHVSVVCAHRKRPSLRQTILSCTQTRDRHTLYKLTSHTHWAEGTHEHSQVQPNWNKPDGLVGWMEAVGPDMPSYQKKWKNVPYPENIDITARCFESR